jgi:glycosyltransferase involved in cell wall biosynthesis
VSGLIVAIDASRIRSGGGVAHLLGILDIEQIDTFGYKEIHVWSYRKLLDLIPDRPWLIKHHAKETEQSLVRQLIWQATKLPQAIREAGCDILFSADVTTVCRFEPMVALNQNMLPYDEGVLRLFGLSYHRLQQNIIYLVQKSAFRFATATIFLTQHAASRVQLHTGPLQNIEIIPHGVGQVFKDTQPQRAWPSTTSQPIECLYVSPILEYKYQWVVVQAIKLLRDRGHHLKLTLVGGGGKRAMSMLNRQIEVSDPKREFVTVLDFVAHEQIPQRIADADIFVFASGCETFGISLLEAMAVGVPIASSSQSSLPETLQDGGVYFDPRDHHSIADAIETLINKPMLRDRLVQRAKALAEPYSWQRCATQTWNFIGQVFREYQLKTNPLKKS